MRIPYINKYVRFGILLSGLWMLVAAISYFLGIYFYPSFMTSALPELYAWIETQALPFEKDGLDFRALLPSVAWLRLALLLALPIIVGWMVFYVVPRSIKWVIDGFTHEHTETTAKTGANASELAGAKVEEVQQPPDAAKHRLNRKQKAVLFTTALLALTALLFPPFVIQHPQIGATYNDGYAFLFSQSGAVVNTGLLALELVVVGAVGVIGYFLTRNT